MIKLQIEKKKTFIEVRLRENIQNVNKNVLKPLFSYKHMFIVTFNAH